MASVDGTHAPEPLASSAPPVPPPARFVPQLHPGQPVGIQVDAFPGQTFTAALLAIDTSTSVTLTPKFLDAF